MPGFLLHVGATAQCSHAGRAQPTVPNPRVTVGGQPTVTIAGPWAIAGCPFLPVSGGPCAIATFITSAVRITSNGQPLLLLDSQALCAPTGVPLMILVTQTRATGS
jgi:hypothetical protein